MEVRPSLGTSVKWETRGVTHFGIVIYSGPRFNPFWDKAHRKSRTSSSNPDCWLSADDREAFEGAPDAALTSSFRAGVVVKVHKKNGKLRYCGPLLSSMEPTTLLMTESGR